MDVFMVRNKSTRWDCDVQLWRGIPKTIPTFHGWNVGAPPERDARFYVCHHCNANVPEVDVPRHPCWDTPVENNGTTTVSEEETTPGSSMTDEEFSRHWEPEEEQERKKTPRSYVVATEENEGDGKCFLCTERLTMVFDQDLEEWVFEDCILVHGKVLHETCNSIVFH